MDASVANVQVPYVAAFSVSAVVSAAVATWVYTVDDAPGTRELAAALAGVTLWAINSLLRVLVADPTLTRVLLTTELFLGVTTAVLLFGFATVYMDRPIRRWRPLRVGLAGLLALSFLLPATNAYHGLVWRDVHPRVVEGAVAYTVVKGPGHYALTVAAYVVALAGLGYLVRGVWRNPPAQPAVLSLVGGVGGLFVANLLPYLVDGLYLTHSTTLTPLGATFAVVAVVVAVRYDLFSLRIVARSTVVELLNDPMIVLDDEGHVLDVNRTFRDRFGAPGRGTAFSEACPDLAARVELEGPATQTVRVGGDGTDHAADAGHYSVTRSPLSSGHRRLGASLVFRDVSDLTNATRRLERQNDQLDEIAYSTAHNLRNPLSVVLGYVDLLETHLDETGAARAETAEDRTAEERTGDGDVAPLDRGLVETSVSAIDQSARRMRVVVTDLVRVTRAAKADEDSEWLELEPLARDAISGVGPDVSLTVERGGRIEANEQRLRLLLEATFRSSRDRADEPVEIRASLTDDGFVVEDTAATIDSTDSDVFLTYGYPSKYPGTGLGLAVARSLAIGEGWSMRLDEAYTAGVRVSVEGARTDTE